MATTNDGAPIPGVLSARESADVRLRFGVAEAQVIRDHAISHILAAIASTGTEDVVFFGGTALARTHLTELRLSEDIDLIALGDRRAIADRIESAVQRSLRRTMGNVRFTPRLRDTRHPDPAVLEVAGLRIQVQLLSHQGYPSWPTEVVDLTQRYSDAPGARLRVLTRSAFAASKLASWYDRHAPRDLYDLWALAQFGAVDREAAELFNRFGPLLAVRSISFEEMPSDEEWASALGHQCLVKVGPQEAAATVRAAISML